jgi:hypothetical protein
MTNSLVDDEVRRAAMRTSLDNETSEIVGCAAVVPAMRGGARSGARGVGDAPLLTRQSE